MAIRNILKDGEPTLKKRSREVLNFDRRLHMLLDDMAETMTEADGAGLAAPQVGVLRRVVIVVGPDGNILELVNPVIAATEGEVTGAEGCLSFPGVYGLVTRPAKVTVNALNRYGRPISVTGEGIVARAFCHEVDHLDGIVFTERADKILTDEELGRLHGDAEEDEE